MDRSALKSEHKQRLHTSSPISIPSRRSISPATVLEPQGSLGSSPRIILNSPELLFDLSPVDIENQASPCRPRVTSVAPCNEADLFLIPPMFSSRFSGRSPSPQSNPYSFRRKSMQSSDTQTTSTTHASSPGYPGSSPELANSRSTATATGPTPIIRTTAVHKIYGFQPQNSSPELQSNSLRIPRTTAGRPCLTPSDSSLSSSLPWLLPGTSDVDDDDAYLSQSPAMFDFKNFLLRRLERRTSSTY